MKKLIKQFHYGERGFTLIELLVVVAILGVLAAVAVPNVSKFMGKGHEEAALTETHNVQTAVLAGMADAEVGYISHITEGLTADFGSVNGADNPRTDCVIIVSDNVTHYVGDYIVGGADSVQGAYTIKRDGEVDLVAYPGI